MTNGKIFRRESKIVTLEVILSEKRLRTRQSLEITPRDFVVKSAIKLPS